MVNHDGFNAFTIRNINDLALASVNADQVLVEGLVEVGLTLFDGVEGVEELVVGRVFPCIVLQSNSNSMDVLEGVADEEI